MKQFIAALTVAALAASPALALDLKSARASGSVCEKATGYVEKTSGGADVDELVSEVNRCPQNRICADFQGKRPARGCGGQNRRRKIAAGPKCK